MSSWTPLTKLTIAFVLGGGAFLFVGTMRMCACSTKWKAYRAATKSDLRNLVIAQEMYYAKYGTYSDDTLALKFASSPGSRLRILSATESTFVAQATHTRLRGTCTIYLGPVPRAELDALPADTVEGVPACDLPPDRRYQR
jgi:hypothetical protein